MPDVPSGFINLLPAYRRVLLVRSYYLRLSVVALFLCMGLIIAAAVLLLPTYIYLVGTTEEKTVQLRQIQTKLSSADESALSDRLTALSQYAGAIRSLSGQPAMSDALRTLLAVPRPGIILNSFSVTPETTERTVLISGVAATRDALRTYQVALDSLEEVVTARLPVSVYAKDSLIPFTVTLTLKP